MKSDELGDRMKKFYENITRIFLPRRTNTIIRIDGNCFSNYTKGLEIPWDYGFISDMNDTAKYLCSKIQGAKLAFVQSDEISIVLTDFENRLTTPWFKGNIQKMASISASMATAEFNRLRIIRAGNAIEVKNQGLSLAEWFPSKMAQFDSRVFTIPSKIEVINYLIWRQVDATRNSIQATARANFSHSECDNKDTNQLQEMLFTERGINWDQLDVGTKRGRLIVKEEYMKGEATRSRWICVEPPIFTKDKLTLSNLIPEFEYDEARGTT